MKSFCSIYTTIANVFFTVFFTTQLVLSNSSRIYYRSNEEFKNRLLEDISLPFARQERL